MGSGADDLEVDTTGNLGGGNNPAAKLEVQSNARLDTDSNGHIDLDEDTSRDLMELYRAMNDVRGRIELVIRTYVKAKGEQGNYRISKDFGQLEKVVSEEVE